jgi:hypothetical protein
MLHNDVPGLKQCWTTSFQVFYFFWNTVEQQRRFRPEASLENGAANYDKRETILVLRTREQGPDKEQRLIPILIQKPQNVACNMATTFFLEIRISMWVRVWCFWR